MLQALFGLLLELLGLAADLGDMVGNFGLPLQRWHRDF
jgi:hypothetical protein